MMPSPGRQVNHLPAAECMERAACVPCPPWHVAWLVQVAAKRAVVVVPANVYGNCYTEAATWLPEGPSPSAAAAGAVEQCLTIDKVTVITHCGALALPQTGTSVVMSHATLLPPHLKCSALHALPRHTLSVQQLSPCFGPCTCPHVGMYRWCCMRGPRTWSSGRRWRFRCSSSPAASSQTCSPAGAPPGARLPLMRKR